MMSFYPPLDSSYQSHQILIDASFNFLGIIRSNLNLFTRIPFHVLFSRLILRRLTFDMGLWFNCYYYFSLD